MMKVLLINGSPRERGNTRAALDEIARTLAAEGVETELISVGTGPVSGCTACGACAKTGRCVLEGGVNEAVEALAAADGLIVGTPVHYASPAGALLVFLDRMFYAGAERFAHKPAAAFACARRAGTTASLDVINKYFTISNMHVASSQYWNQVHGNTPEQTLQDIEGMQTMRTLGQNIAWLIKSIEAGETGGLAAPEYEKRQRTNFIQD